MKLDLLKVGGPLSQVTVAYPDNVTEVYTYKNDSGLTLATITVVYTDSTKEDVSSVTRT